MYRKIPKGKVLKAKISDMDVSARKSITPKYNRDSGFLKPTGELDHNDIWITFSGGSFSTSVSGRDNLEKLKELIEFALEMPEGEE